jgi:trehalose-phosphatase
LVTSELIPRSWQDSVLKILQGFTDKTEGSFIKKKEAIITWYYKDCDIYFGHVQANEINTHLTNIFENCKLDIVNGKGYVEIKPRNVNKGYFISEIIKEEFVNKRNPDFIFTVGDDTSDEEMFKYLNCVHSQLNYYNENMKIFTTTIGRKPSSAKYFFNEVPEVLEYLECLNQSSSGFPEYTRMRKKTHSTKYFVDTQLITKNSKSESYSSLLPNSLNNI